MKNHSLVMAMCTGAAKLPYLHGRIEIPDSVRAATGLSQ
jgi:hypothetical protein